MKKLTLLLGLALIPTALTSCSKSDENTKWSFESETSTKTKETKVEESSERLIAPTLELNGNSEHQYTYLVKNENNIAVTYYSQNLPDGLCYEIKANDYVLIDGAYTTDNDNEFVIIAGYFSAYKQKDSFVSRLTINKNK